MSIATRLDPYAKDFPSTKNEVDPDFKTHGRLCYMVERPAGEEVRTVATPDQADVISSEVGGTNWHKPVIDIDLPIRVLPSTTLGHFHLYIDKAMPWRDYKRLLKALKKAGVIEPGYYGASVHRRATHVRLPWVKKKPTGDPLASTY